MPTLTLKTEWTDEEVKEFCQDILTVAAEGSIGYWADFTTERDEDLNVTALLNVATSPVDDGEEGEPVYDRVDVTTIWRTIHQICDGQHDNQVHPAILSWIKDDAANKECSMIDADGADVVVQLAVFDDLVYG